MKLLVTGAAGFLGSAVVARAVNRGHEVRAMVRPGGPRPELPHGKGSRQVQLYEGNLTDSANFPDLLRGSEGVIHCAAVTSAGATNAALSQKVNIEGTRALLEAAHMAGVRHWVQISSMSAHPGSTSVYGRTKLGADEILRQSTPPPTWTILRPSLIYGPGQRGLVAKTTGLLRKLPFIPILGSGREKIRPIYVNDVAEAALTCLATPATAGRTFMLGGPTEVTLNEFMRRLAAGAGLKRPLLHLPLPLCMVLARVMGACLKTPPISVDNVLGVKEAQPVHIEEAQQGFGFEPIPLEQGLNQTFKRQK